MRPYETPSVTIEYFGNDTFMTASGEPTGIPKNPGHHELCTMMPNGKPIPENAVGYWGNHDEP